MHARTFTLHTQAYLSDKLFKNLCSFTYVKYSAIQWVVNPLMRLALMRS